MVNFMKMYLISDNVDTVTGLRLAGIDGVVVHEKEELLAIIEYLETDKEIGIVLVTEKLSLEFNDIINNYKLTHRQPLVLEIPDRHGSTKRADFITAYINEAIGVKL